ncbi:hypothetical protein MRB53_030175 [Persea americana]|uniref:Uncharacterized protein n=1 Tax=Persea americana TaxID=3435 RepID=A0ACC2KKK3_PERAE|nr:hypothetical protein MRB53_030175 [Persea americana]
MVERGNPNKQSLPVLQKPPGYRDPNAPHPPSKPKPPPPRKTLPPSFPHRRRRSRHCCRCCCLLSVLLLLFFAAAASLFYLWSKPHLPIFHLQSLRTPLLKIAVKPDGTFLSAQTVVRIQATNPNGKFQFYYGRSQARITVDDGVDLGSGDFPRFGQSQKNTTVMKFSSQVKEALIDDGVGSSLRARARSRRLDVHVEVRTRFGVRLGNWSLGKVGIRVLCGGTLKRLQGGERPQCKINLLKWINLN